MLRGFWATRRLRRFSRQIRLDILLFSFGMVEDRMGFRLSCILLGGGGGGGERSLCHVWLVRMFSIVFGLVIVFN